MINDNADKIIPQAESKVPARRFPEFRKSQPWRLDKIGNLIQNYGGTSLEEFTNPAGKYKFISIGNYSATGNYVDNSQRIDGNPKTLSKLLNTSDLVMILNDKTTKGDIIGATILIDLNETYIYNQRSERIICKDGVKPKFLWYYLNSIEFRRKIYALSQGGTQIYVNFPAVKQLNVVVPCLAEEQEKIAECLSSVDNLIGTKQTELESLKKYKKGLLQQLFPQGNSNLPAICFPEFNGNWTELLDKPKIISGIAYKLSDYSTNGIPIIQGANIFHGYFNADNLKFIDNMLTTQLHVMVNRNDILIGLNRPIIDNQLKICKFPLDSGYLYQRAGILKLPVSLNKDFIYHYLCSDMFLNYLKKELVGSDQPYIKANIFERFQLWVPPSEEQKKIADCLISLDNLINLKQQELDKLSLYKKGLLQQLLVQG